MRLVKSIIAVIAIAISAMHLTAAPALAKVECEGVEPTPLHKAIHAGDFEEARKQIKPEYVNVLAQYKVGNTVHCYAPLHRIALRDNASRKLTEAFIAAGANIKVRDDDGNTALHYAAASDNVVAVTALVGAGADWEVENNSGVTPLDIAWGRDFISFIRPDYADEAAKDSAYLFTAAKAGDAAQVKASLQAGADPLARDGDGNTALHFAATANNVEVITALLEAGTNPRAKNKDGETALHLAARHGKSEEVFRALIAACADITAQNKTGQTAVDIVNDPEAGLYGSAIYWELQDGTFQTPADCE